MFFNGVFMFSELSWLWSFYEFWVFFVFWDFIFFELLYFWAFMFFELLCLLSFNVFWAFMSFELLCFLIYFFSFYVFWAFIFFEILLLWALMFFGFQKKISTQKLLMKLLTIDVIDQAPQLYLQKLKPDTLSYLILIRNSY